MKPKLTVWAVCVVGVIFLAAGGCATAKKPGDGLKREQHTVNLENCDRQLVAVRRGDELLITAKADSSAQFQWIFRGKAINDSTGPWLVIPCVDRKSIGLYQCRIREYQHQRTYELNLQMYTGGTRLSEPIIITGIPGYPGGKSGASCPGKYRSYASFGKALPAWGWVPLAGGGTARNNSGVSAKVEGCNISGKQTPCGSPSITMTGTEPCQFTLYFSGSPGTASIRLDNFAP